MIPKSSSKQPNFQLLKNVQTENLTPQGVEWIWPLFCNKTHFLCWQKVWTVKFGICTIQNDLSHCHFYSSSSTGGEHLEQNIVPWDMAPLHSWCAISVEHICTIPCHNECATSACALYTWKNELCDEGMDGTSTTLTPFLVAHPWSSHTSSIPATSTAWWITSMFMKTKIIPEIWSGWII